MQNLKKLAMAVYKYSTYIPNIEVRVFYIFSHKITATSYTGYRTF